MRALFAALLLAACSGGGAQQAELAGPNRVCADEADRAPAVQSLMMKAAGSPEFYAAHQDEIASARREAELVCMRRLGLAPPGGVEAPKRPNSLFQGL